MAPLVLQSIAPAPLTPPVFFPGTSLPSPQITGSVNGSVYDADTVKEWLSTNPDPQAEASLRTVDLSLSDVTNLLPPTIQGLACNGTSNYHAVYHDALATVCRTSTTIFFIGLFLKAGLFVVCLFAIGIAFCICRQPAHDAVWDDDDERRPLLQVCVCVCQKKERGDWGLHNVCVSRTP